MKATQKELDEYYKTANSHWRSAVVPCRPRWTRRQETAWGLYYPPFQGSGEAGVSEDICTYDEVNRIYSRSNEKELRNFHGWMRFKSLRRRMRIPSKIPGGTDGCGSGLGEGPLHKRVGGATALTH